MRRVDRRGGLDLARGRVTLARREEERRGAEMRLGAGARGVELAGELREARDRAPEAAARELGLREDARELDATSGVARAERGHRREARLGDRAERARLPGRQ